MEITWKVLSANNNAGSILVEYTSISGHQLVLNINARGAANVVHSIELSAPLAHFDALENPVIEQDLTTYVDKTAKFNVNYTPYRAVTAANTTASGSAPNVIS